jgi:hypothetical protein
MAALNLVNPVNPVKKEVVESFPDYEAVSRLT